MDNDTLGFQRSGDCLLASRTPELRAETPRPGTPDKNVRATLQQFNSLRSEEYDCTDLGRLSRAVAACIRITATVDIVGFVQRSHVSYTGAAQVRLPHF